MSGLRAIVIAASIILAVDGVATAGGPFGPPQPVSKDAGGIYTGIGYWYHEDKYENGTEFATRKNQAFSQLGYGARHWEVYGRIGVSDLEMPDALGSTQTSTTTSRNDFEDHWKFSGTLGAKGFYPFNKTFGVGAFMQGCYYFSDFIDDVSGTQAGTPYATRLKVKHLWDVTIGLGLQATAPYGIKLYIGPYAYYSEAKLSFSATIPGLKPNAGSAWIHNKTNVGGFTGVDVPLGKGFRLIVEGQYAARFSAGAAITYSY